MNIKIKCERCGVEKDLEIKVPKFCSNECRIASLKERMTKKREEAVEPSPEVVLEPTSEAITEVVPDVSELQGQTNETNN